MSPIDIQVLLWLYASPLPLRENLPNADSPAVGSALQLHSQSGLIEPSDKGESGYVCTEKGRVFVQALCSLPLPVGQWVMPDPRAERAASDDLWRTGEGPVPDGRTD